MRKSIVNALALCFVFSSFAFGDHVSPGGPVDPGLNVIYDPATGNLDWLANSQLFTTLEIKSANNWFVGAATDYPDAGFAPPFDIYSAAKVFKLSTGGVGKPQVNFANIGAGRSVEDLETGLEFAGSIVGGGSLDAATGGFHVKVVPEPTSIVLFCLGGLALLARRRK